MGFIHLLKLIKAHTWIVVGWISQKSENYEQEWLPKGTVGFCYQEGCRVGAGQEKHVLTMCLSFSCRFFSWVNNTNTLGVIHISSPLLSRLETFSLLPSWMTLFLRRCWFVYFLLSYKWLLPKSEAKETLSSSQWQSHRQKIGLHVHPRTH